MKRILNSALIAAPLAIVSTFAFADGLAEPVAAPTLTTISAAAPTSVGRDWTGFYGGVSLGFGDVDADGVSGSFDGATFGGHVGYNYDLGDFVLGGELEAVGTNDFENDTNGLELDSVLRAKIRAGYDAGDFLPYVTGGFAQASIDDIEDEGYFFGIGLDYAWTDNTTVSGEYLRHEFNDFTNDDDISADSVALRVSFRF